MYKLRLCTRCNSFKEPVQVAKCTSRLYKLQVVQVATCTRLGVQLVPCTEFHHQIIQTCTVLFHKLDLKRNFVQLRVLLKIFVILCV